MGLWQLWWYSKQRERGRKRERKKIIIILSATGWGQKGSGTLGQLQASHYPTAGKSTALRWKRQHAKNKDDRCGTMFVFVMIKVWTIINLDKDCLIRAAVQPLVHRFLICWSSHTGLSLACNALHYFPFLLVIWFGFNWFLKGTFFCLL